MAAWRGWDEEAVRLQMATENAEMVTQTSDVQAGSGFTPINSGQHHEVDVCKVSSIGEMARPAQTQLNKAVTEYLGCTAANTGKGDKKTVASSLQVPGARRVRKGAKRAATTTAVSRPKRQKSNGLAHVMPSSKPGLRVAPCTSTKEFQQETPHPGACDQPEEQNGNEPQHLGAAVRPVYAPTTSVDELQYVGPKTSMSAVKASGHGYVVYQRQASIRTSNCAKFTRPLLSQCPTTPGVQDENKSHSETPSSHLPTLDESAPYDRYAIDGYDDGLPLDCDEDETLRLLEVAESNAKAVTLSPHTIGQQETLLPTPANSDAVEAWDSCAKEWLAVSDARRLNDDLQGPDEDFMNLCDSDVESVVAVEHVSPEGSSEDTPPFRDRNQNQREVDQDDHYGGAFLSEQDIQLLEQLHLAKATARKRIVRSSFPPSILDRSPIFGASNKEVLRTCFRIGEALNAGSQAFRAGRPMIIELYARAMSSHREDKPVRRQHFVFHDLYHDKPPHLEGAFELGDQSRLWDLDSKPFLSGRLEGIMCRVMAKVTRENSQWRLHILSIWECDWEDVDYVAGIYRT